MSADFNPYDAESPDSYVQLTFWQRVVAAGTGIIVLVASLMVMVAFLFGILVAFAERSTPAPVSISALLASPLGRLLKIGALGMIPVAVLIGVFSTLRVMRVQRSLLGADFRRKELRLQVDAIRRLHQTNDDTLSPGKESDRERLDA